MEFTERMEQARDAAAAKRHRGQFTGASAAGWDWSRPDPAKGSFARARQAVVASWQAAAWMAQEDYLRVTFPERYSETETLESVIAAQHAAETDAILETF